MKRLRFSVLGMMALVAIVAIGLYSRIVYQRYEDYHSSVLMYERFLREDQLDIDRERAEIAKLRESVKALNREIELSENSGKDPSTLKELKMDRWYLEANIQIYEETIEDVRRSSAGYEKKRQRYSYLRSHPWIIEDDSDLDLVDEEDDEPLHRPILAPPQL